MPVFRVYEAPTSETLARLVSGTDRPCVWGPEFLAATSGRRSRIVAFSVEGDGACLAVALGTLRARRLRSVLTLPTDPRFLDDAVRGEFWSGLAAFCRAAGVQVLRVRSFEAAEAGRPPLGRLAAVQERDEYFLHLQAMPGDLLGYFSGNHRRNARKALRLDPEYRVSASEDDLRSHLDLVGHTAERRRSRHESLPGINDTLFRRLIRSGEGRLMQLHAEGEVLSSFLTLVTPRRAFYFSGGTGERGMKVGASHALMFRTALDLREQGVETLSLGGIARGDPDGLARYKLGFGAQCVALAHHEFYTGPALMGPVLRWLGVVGPGRDAVTPTS